MMYSLLLALTAFVSVSCDRPTKIPAGASGIVVHVVDGDTIDVDMGSTTERVRLIGIDTPETKKPNTPVQCFGPEASAHTSELLPEGTAVLILRDHEARDPYGRLLGYVWRFHDATFINADLIANGYARPLRISPNTAFAWQFAEEAGDARIARKGLWGACDDR